MDGTLQGQQYCQDCECQVNDKASTLLVTKSNSDNDENGWHKDNNSDCEFQVDDDKDLFARLADGLTQEDKMQQGITACAQATIDGGMVQSKDKESCTNGLGAAQFFPSI